MIQKQNIAYYVTCVASGMVEIGTIFWGINKGYNIEAVLGLALAYQLGNVLRFFVDKEKVKYQTHAIVFIISLSIILAINHNIPDSITYSIEFLMFLLYSTVLQNVRSAAKGNVPRWRKRSCRVIGFVLSALFYSYGTQIMFVVSVLLMYYSLRLDKFYYDKRSYGKSIELYWSMITHQAHYFTYTYIMVVIVLQYYSNPWITTLWFAANWVPYTITEPLVKKLHINNWYSVSIWAHLFNAIVIVLMLLLYNKNIVLMLCCWILTGFGGGNVFCVKKTIFNNKRYDEYNWNLSEQIGHILGVTVAILLAIVGLEIYSLLIAAIFALITIPIIKKEKGEI